MYSYRNTFDNSMKTNERFNGRCVFPRIESNYYSFGRTRETNEFKTWIKQNSRLYLGTYYNYIVLGDYSISRDSDTYGTSWNWVRQSHESSNPLTSQSQAEFDY